MITKMLAHKRAKDKIDLFLDDEYACSLTLESVAKHRLGVGVEISVEQLKAILIESDGQIAFAFAVKSLCRNSKTTSQMKEKLLQKGFDEIVVQNVLQKLLEYKFLDDESFCRHFVSYSKSQSGARKIAFQLKQKGVNAELISDVCSNIGDEQENAKILAEKFLRNRKKTMDTMSKLQRHLLSKGFDFEVIKSVAKSLGELEHEENSI